MEYKCKLCEFSTTAMHDLASHLKTVHVNNRRGSQELKLGSARIQMGSKSGPKGRRKKVKRTFNDKYDYSLVDAFVGVNGFSEAQAEVTKAEIRKGTSEINTFNTFFGLSQGSLWKRCLICPEGDKSNTLKSDMAIVRHLNRDAL